MKGGSWNELRRKTLQSPKARAAYDETKLRERLALVFSEAMKRQRYTVRQLAKELDTSISQIQRIVNRDVGGPLTLLTVVKAANALGLELDVRLHPDGEETAVVCSVE